MNPEFETSIAAGDDQVRAKYDAESRWPVVIKLSEEGGSPHMDLETAIAMRDALNSVIQYAKDSS